MVRPAPLSATVRDQFRRQRTRDTKPELALRSALHRAGLRFRVDRSVLPDRRFRADVVFGPTRVAVFVDGCFWHSCPIHGNRPKNNAEWWAVKLDANVERDRSTDGLLTAAGWLPVRVWEHEDATVAAARIGAVVTARRASGRERARVSVPPAVYPDRGPKDPPNEADECLR
jgi:DNA mismatch endonuclease (patch repair protein)